MTKEELFFQETGSSIKGAELSNMFGKPCFKVNGKAFVCLFENCMVFKLSGSHHEKAMKLKGSCLFDPSGKDRAMKEWVQVTFANKEQWKDLAGAAFDYVKSSKK